MRLRQRDLTTVYFKKRIVTQDEEANDVVDYATEFTELKMNVQSAGGAVNAQIYGERLAYMKSCKYQGDDLEPTKNEGDGICVYVEKDAQPDYKIVSIHEFSTHLNIMLERIGGVGDGG